MSKLATISLDGVDVSRPLSDFSGCNPPASAIAAARQYLGLFVLRQALETADQIGFGWVEQPDAPDTYDDLLAVYDRSKATGEPLPVSDQHCDRSIYLTSEVNLALRFWHDSQHVLRGRSFRVVDEIDMALWHLDVAAHDGVAKHSVARHLLESDMLGQTLCISALGRFPLDQYLFDLSCLTFGIPEAIVLEAEHVASPFGELLNKAPAGIPAGITPNTNRSPGNSHGDR